MCPNYTPGLLYSGHFLERFDVLVLFFTRKLNKMILRSFGSTEDIEFPYLLILTMSSSLKKMEGSQMEFTHGGSGLETGCFR